MYIYSEYCQNYELELIWTTMEIACVSNIIEGDLYDVRAISSQHMAHIQQA